VAIDRFQYPWLHVVAQGADWLGTDEFHEVVAVGGGRLWETWLSFVAVNGGLPHYVSRLKGGKDQCAIAFNEIAVAHFFATECRMRILGWQSPGLQNTLGEFLVGPDANRPIFVEVKSPRWQAEIAQGHGDSHPRLKMPKYVGIETRPTNPWVSVDYAVEKAYRKMPGDKPSLLVIKDDLFVSLADWAAITRDIGLYAPKSGLNADGGVFVDRRYERLGGVGVLKVGVGTPFRGVRYDFSLFENPHALPPVALPPEICGGYPRYNALGRMA
jgi:hypothetical protein